MKPDIGSFLADHKVVQFFADKVVLFLSYLILAFLVVDSFIALLPHGHGTVICFIGSNSVTSGQQSYINEYCADQVSWMVYLVPLLVFGQGLLTILLHYSWYSMVLYWGNAAKKKRKMIMEANEMVAVADTMLAEKDKRMAEADKRVAEAAEMLAERDIMELTEANVESAREKKKLAEADKRKAEADKRKAEADKRMAEADKRKAEADKRKAEADKRMAEADKRIAAEADKKKAEADKKIAEADKRMASAEASKRIAEADKMLAEAEANKKNAEADKKIAEADDNMAEADKMLAEAEANKKKAEADKKIAEADKNMAEADKNMAEADKMLAEADIIKLTGGTVLKAARKKLADADKKMVEADKMLAVASKAKVAVDIERATMKKKAANKLLTLVNGKADGLNATAEAQGTSNATAAAQGTSNATAAPQDTSNATAPATAQGTSNATAPAAAQGTSNATTAEVTQGTNTGCILQFFYCLKNLLQFALGVLVMFLSFYYEFGNETSYDIQKNFNCSIKENIATDYWDHLDTVQCYYTSIALNDVFIMFYGFISGCVSLVTCLGILGICVRQDIKMKKCNRSCRDTAWKFIKDMLTCRRCNCRESIQAACYGCICSRDTAIIKYCRNESNADISIIMEELELTDLS